MSLFNVYMLKNLYNTLNKLKVATTFHLYDIIDYDICIFDILKQIIVNQCCTATKNMLSQISLSRLRKIIGCHIDLMLCPDIILTKTFILVFTLFV